MLAILLCAVVGADPDVESPAPKVPPTPPSMVRVSLSGGKLVNKVQVTAYRQEKETKKVVNKEGKVEEIVQFVNVPELRMVEITYDLKTMEVSTAGGKPLDLDAVKKRLARPQVVVVSGDGKAIDQAFLDALDKETIVLVPQQVRPK